jgi:hypothetical protein
MAAAIVAHQNKRRLERLKNNKENFWAHEYEDTVELMKKYTEGQGDDVQHLTHEQLEGCLRDVNREVLLGMEEVYKQHPKVAQMMGLKKLPPLPSGVRSSITGAMLPRLRGMHSEPSADEIAYVLRHIDNGGDFEKVEVDEVNKALTLWNEYLWELPKLEMRLQQYGLTPSDEAADAALKALGGAAKELDRPLLTKEQLKVFMQSYLIKGDAPVTDDSVEKLLKAFNKPNPDTDMSRADLHFFGEFWRDTLAKRREKKLQKSSSCVVL